MNLFDELRNKLGQKGIKLVFPEGTDARVLGACVDLQKEGAVEPVVLGVQSEIEKVAQENELDLTGLTIVNPLEYDEFDAMVKAFVERRKGKITQQDAREKLKTDNNYFGTMLVYLDKAEGLISGATNSTGATILPALQIIKMKPGLKKTSGSFIMVKGEERLIFADCAINIMPSAEDLAESAKVSSMTAKQFGVDPVIGLLSFSTKGSAKSEETEKVIEALRIAKEKYPELKIDGELQFDAAYVESVGQSKAKGSTVAGHVNTFIFPTLDAGNIGYKIAQRLGGYEAIGPVLQGLNKPVNDLSRGCDREDVYNLALITAVQALED